MRSGGADVSAVDACPFFDDMDKRHSVATAEPVVVFEPFEDDGCLNLGCVVAAALGDVEKLTRRETGFVFDGV